MDWRTLRLSTRPSPASVSWARAGSRRPARCSVSARPLDLVFILDSSGSLRNKFQDEIDVIRRIVGHVTVGPKATRVMLVQFR